MILLLLLLLIAIVEGGLDYFYTNRLDLQRAIINLSTTKDRSKASSTKKISTTKASSAKKSAIIRRHISASNESGVPMMYNFTGTIIVMTQVLLPFMILPIYSIMKGIPPSYMKAAQNLGATPTRAFIRVYMPQSVPGVGAGCILVFIVAIGYYITPELVGGKDGLMIGNFVAREMQQTLNWGLAAAMGTMLLFAVLALYWVYDKFIGIDNLKMG